MLQFTWSKQHEDKMESNDFRAGGFPYLQQDLGYSWYGEGSVGHEG